MGHVKWHAILLTLLGACAPAGTELVEDTEEVEAALVGKPTAIGVFRPAPNAVWLLRMTTSPGDPEIISSYGNGGDIPVPGDWIGAGYVSIGVFRPANSQFNPTTEGQWLLRLVPFEGPPSSMFFYCAPGDIPVVGDWDGNGTMTIGVFRPAGAPFNPGTQARWFLRNSNSAGAPSIDVLYGAPGDLPVVGDWDGNGTTTIGVYRPATATADGQWLLRNANSPGTPAITLSYGTQGDIPVPGDWDGNGSATIGVFRPTGSRWLLRNSNTPGLPSFDFSYGAPGDVPVVGNWPPI